jgi:cytidine deaminase
MQGGELSLQFQQILETFPSRVHEALKTIQNAGGMLSPEHCRAVMESLTISAEDLMLRLLPLARLYSATAISGFQVGAVAKARMPDRAGDPAFFLGANIEFPAQALTQTIHAEQCAVVNAWLQGAGRVETIAVTAAPCGYCRQFLYELDGGQNLKILIDRQTGEKATPQTLSEFLPQAFGPRQLGQSTGLMARPAQPAGLRLQPSSNDPLVQQAWSAANQSYAPYSRNCAGIAVKSGNGSVFAGRYVENAAFNPSLSPLHTALVQMNMDRPDVHHQITRAVLVERPTAICQRPVCEQLLQSVAPGVNLEYYEAK